MIILSILMSIGFDHPAMAAQSAFKIYHAPGEPNGCANKETESKRNECIKEALQPWGKMLVAALTLAPLLSLAGGKKKKKSATLLDSWDLHLAVDETDWTSPLVRMTLDF